MKKGISVVLCGLMSMAAVSQVVAAEDQGVTISDRLESKGEVVEMRLAANDQSKQSDSSQQQSGTMTQRKVQTRKQVRTRSENTHRGDR